MLIYFTKRYAITDWRVRCGVDTCADYVICSIAVSFRTEHVESSDEDYQNWYTKSYKQLLIKH